MKPFTRRDFLRIAGSTAALAATTSFSRRAAAAVAPRVVVVGGGFAGATAAKYLRHWGGNIDVTLVDANPSHVSCILSNLVLNGRVGLSGITFDYENLRAKYGVKPRQGQVTDVDAAARQVRLADGSRLPYDRLVLAPGIDFDTVPGLDPSLVPHAWKAGPQTLLLKSQLTAMPAGGTVVQTIPLAPYRCPPGPYERACVIADFLKRKKRGSKIIVLDANPGIVAEKNTFTKAFTQTYAGILEYRPGVTLLGVDSARRIAITSAGQVRGSVLNVIPRQRAGGIIAAAGLANDASGRWAAVNPLSYESTAVANIHVIGDSQGTGQPKAGHIANGEAKVCADAIVRAFAGQAPDPAPMTNSACYSPITYGTASWLTAVFAYDPVSGTMKSVPEAAGEASAPSSENFEKMFEWATNLFSDTFD